MNAFSTRLSVDLDAAFVQFEDGEAGIAAVQDGDGLDADECHSE